MRDDLLDALAAIDWAISDLPILEERLFAWWNNNPYRLFGDLNSQPGKKVIRLCDVKPIYALFPSTDKMLFSFNVEILEIMGFKK